MKKFYTLRDQCIIKNSPTSFSILDPRGGGMIDVNLKGLIVYFSIHGKTNIEKIIDECKQFGISVNADFVKKTIKKLLELNLIELSPQPSPSPFHFPSVLKNSLTDFSTYPAALSLCELEISISNECPYKCVYCYRGDGKKKNISFSKLKEIIKDASFFGARSLFFSGGEPLLEIKKIKKLTKLAKKKNFINICIATSGFGFSSDIARELKEAGVDSIIVKLDSISPKTFSKITNYKYAFQNAKKTIEIGKKYFEEVIGNMVITELNKDEIDKVINWAIKNKGIDRMKISPPIPIGRASHFILEENIIKEIIKKTNFYQKFYGNLKVICPYTISPKFHFQTLVCLAGTTLAFISENGDVSPCPYFVNKLVVSNIYRERFKDVWPTNSVLQQLRKPVNINSTCMKCKKRYYCFDNCRFLSFLKFGSLTMDSFPKCLEMPSS